MIAHLMACTLCAMAAAAAALAMRRSPAAFRHAILLAAVLRFALPTEWLVGAGGRLVPHLRTSPAVDQIGALLLHPGAVALRPLLRGADRSPQPWIALWGIGCAGCLLVWAARGFRRLPAVRPPNAAEAEILPGVPLRIVAADRVPGACGWLRPCVVLPDGLSEQLTPAELRAIAAHELAHLRRRDNLWAALAHVVISVFWFHPLLWWMERRMLEERETACDEMVLRAGTEPGDYISGIAKVCRMSFAGAAGYAGVTGSNLKTRMEQIMLSNYNRNSAPFPRAAAGASLAVLMLLPLAAGFLRAQEPPSPQHPDAMFQAGMAAMKARHYDDAYEDFRKCQEAYPYPNFRGLMGMVEVRLAQGRVDDAVRLLDGALAEHPSPDLKMAMGNILVRTGRYDRALGVFQELLDSGVPGTEASADLYLRIGETYRRKGDDAASIAALQKARQRAPDNPVVLSTLALTLDHAGRHEEAAQGYRDALEVNPNSGIALNNLAYLMTDGGDLDLALAYAKRAVEALPGEPNARDTLGWVYLKRNQTREAFAAFRQAFEEKPAEPAFRTHLAMALDRRGDASSGTAELKRLLRAPDSTENEQRIRTLLQAIQ